MTSPPRLPSPVPFGVRAGWTRRALLGAIAGGIAVVAFGIGALRWGVRRRMRSAPVRPSDLEAALPTAAALAAASQGAMLDTRGLDEVVTELRRVTGFDAELASAMPAAARFADAMARRQGAASFLEAGPDVREAVVDALLRPSVDSRWSAARALVSNLERDRRVVRWIAVDRLARVYAGSAPAWRRRGYHRWPGMPGDPREYTRPGPEPAC